MILHNAAPLSRGITIAVLLLALAACDPVRQPACASGEQLLVHESLYFGTGKPNGVVTPTEWAEFVKTVVTPRFPEGLTVFEASGQWRGADGVIVREASYVLNLLHPGDAAHETAVLEIAAAYKSQFQQESVLRVKAQACASF